MEHSLEAGISLDTESPHIIISHMVIHGETEHYVRVVVGTATKDRYKVSTFIKKYNSPELFDPKDTVTRAGDIFIDCDRKEVLRLERENAGLAKAYAATIGKPWSVDFDILECSAKEYSEYLIKKYTTKKVDPDGGEEIAF